MNDFLPSDAKALHCIIDDNEEWLIDRILYCAKRQGYTKYTSTLREAWRQSIAGLSRSLLDTLEKGMFEMELGPEENYTADPLTQFGVLQAERHRKRGVALNMFLGLMKCYRQSYLDLVAREVADWKRVQRIAYLFGRVFDRLEIGLVTAWNAPSNSLRRVELQQANRAVTNEKNKYLTLFESLQLPIAVLDADHCIDTVNHAWVQFFAGERTPGEQYYETARIGHSLSWLSEEIKALTESQENEMVFEKTIKTISGRRHLAVRIKRILAVSEKSCGSVILLDDVSAQKQMESALHETSIWLKEMFNALEEAVFLATPTGRIVDANTAAVKIFGYTLEEMKNNTAELFHADQDRFQLFNSRVRETLSKGERAVFDCQLKRKTGELFPVMVNIALLKESEKRPLGIVCVLRDISELKKMEDAKRNNLRLQGVLELAGAVCHDMNQPLMAISGYAELALMECPEDAPYTDKLEKIIAQVTKVGSITKKLMNVTRYETKTYLDQQIIDIEKSSGIP